MGFVENEQQMIPSSSMSLFFIRQRFSFPKGSTAELLDISSLCEDVRFLDGI